MSHHLFCFGLGYVADRLIKLLSASEKDWMFSGTKRVATGGYAAGLAEVHEFDNLLALPTDVTHVLISIPPHEDGDLVFNKFGPHLARLKKLEWLGYLSTTGVYGDTKGEWVNEDSPINPGSPFAKNREISEQIWANFCEKNKIPYFIFRLSGIYGPGRSVINRVLAGKAQIIDKPEQVFSRIHVHDIAHAIQLSMHNPLKPGVYNLADDYPCNSEELITYTCKLLNIDSPKPIPLEKAELGEMGKHFYNECRRVSNEKVKKDLGLKLKFPTYKEGILHILNS